MTRRCVLDFAALHSAEQAYAALSAQLDLPAHFGRNLDALWDSLTVDVAGPIEIVLKDVALRPYAAGIVAVLRDAARQRADLRLIEQ